MSQKTSALTVHAASAWYDAPNSSPIVQFQSLDDDVSTGASTVGTGFGDDGAGQAAGQIKAACQANSTPLAPITAALAAAAAAADARANVAHHGDTAVPPEVLVFRPHTAAMLGPRFGFTHKTT
jgi:hypothetical protein